MIKKYQLILTGILFFVLTSFIFKKPNKQKIITLTYNYEAIGLWRFNSVRRNGIILVKIYLDSNKYFYKEIYSKSDYKKDWIEMGSIKFTDSFEYLHKENDSITIYPNYPKVGLKRTYLSIINEKCPFDFGGKVGYIGMDTIIMGRRCRIFGMEEDEIKFITSSEYSGIEIVDYKLGIPFYQEFIGRKQWFFKRISLIEIKEELK